MSVRITGSNTSLVRKIQERVDNFNRSFDAYRAREKELNEWAAKNVELADIPAHQARYQTLLGEFKKATENLKANADTVQKKTDQSHIHKYFRRRRTGINRTLGMGPKDSCHVNPSHKEYLEGIHKAARAITGTDYATSINQAQTASQRIVQEAQIAIEAVRRNAEAAREFSQIDQTFPSCRERLITENPEEYLRQAALFQCKLLENKDETTVLEFGKSWIKDLPKEATWQQVESMSLVMVQAAKTNKGVDLTEYRTAVEQWLVEHPLSENSDPVDLISAQTSPWGRRTYILGLLYLSNQNLDLSPEACQIYKSCSSLYPDQHPWKMAQAFFHIANLQWAEAEQLLADLPKDDASVIDTQRYLKVAHARYHISNLQWAEAEQLLADLPKDDASVIDAQRYLKLAHAHYHIANLQWKEAEQLLADLPKDDASVIDAQRYLKVAHAHYHISNLEWVEAGQLLADLPKDDASVIEAQKSLADNLKERFCSAGLDLGLIALSRLTPSSWKETVAFDSIQTGLQLVSSGHVRRMWIPLVLSTSERSIPSHLPFSSIVTTVGDIVDFVFRNNASLRNHQKLESFASYTLRTVETARTLYSNPLQRSLPSMLSLGSLLISVSQTYDAYREIRRPAAQQAFLSTLQLMTSDLSTAITIRSYSDLLPVVGIRPQQIATQLGAESLTARVSSDPSLEVQGNSRNRWHLAALGIGSLAAYRFYFDYPYLWAASVMKEAEFYSSQEKHDDAQRVLTEAENSYFVSSVKPAVRNYAAYANWLRDYPKFLEDPAKYKEFLMDLDLVLHTLKASSHYRGIRNNLLLKKMVTAIGQQDTAGLNEVLNEGPDGTLVTVGFHFLLNCSFYLALKDPAAACSFLEKMKPSFPSCFTITDSLLKLLQAQSTALQELSQINLLTLLQNPPSSEKARRWNAALQELQSFFSENIGESQVCQDLQYYKLMISFAQKDNTQKTEGLFKESDPELHQRFSHELVQCTRLLWKAGRRNEAIDLLKRVQFNSFKDNWLIQNYGHFFSSLYLSPLQGDPALEQIKNLESCIAGLDIKKDFHQELRIFFSACKVVLTLDAGEYANAKNLLTQETADSKVPDEVAALLFERVYVSMHGNGVENAQSDLKGIIENLEPWRHLELFKTFQAYIVCEPTLEAHLERLTAVITQMEPIGQLSNIAVNLQLRKKLLEFELRLSQGRFEEAKNLLTASMPKEFHAELCNLLYIFIINQGLQLRQTTSSRKVNEILQGWNSFFGISNSGIIQSYLNFLAHLDNLEKKKEFAAHDRVYQSLESVFEKLNIIGCPIPESLKGEKVKILINTALLATVAGQPKKGLAALDSIEQVGIHDKHLDQYIGNLREQLNA